MADQAPSDPAANSEPPLSERAPTGGKLFRHPWDRIAGFLLLVALLQWLVDPYIYSRSTLNAVITASDNPHVAEAVSWRAGRLSLDERYYDTAEFGGRFYNVFPPLFTLVCSGLLSWFPQGVPRWVLLFLIWVPIPLLAYITFLRTSGGVLSAVVMSTALILGTSYSIVLQRAVTTAPVWQTDHALSQIGLLILLADYFGKGRIWLGSIGLMLSVWSRPLTVLYAIPLIAKATTLPGPVRTRRLAAAAPVWLITLALPLTLNAMKFGNPLEFGYRYIYQGRDDEPAQRAQHGLFSLRFVPDNLRALLGGFPQIERENGRTSVIHNEYGTGVWWTSPLLLYLLICPRDWWRDRSRRWLMISAGIVLAVILTYHTTGYAQRGYNRFSLDYIVVLLAVLGATPFGRRRSMITLAMVGWSVWYFRWVG